MQQWLKLEVQKTLKLNMIVWTKKKLGSPRGTVEHLMS